MFTRCQKSYFDLILSLFVQLKSSSFEPNSYKQDIIALKCFFKVVHLSQPFVLSIQVQSGSKFPLPAGPLRRYISIRLHHCALESRRLQLTRGRAREPPYLLYFQRNVFPFASTLNPYANPQKQMTSCCCCCGPDVCLQYHSIFSEHNITQRRGARDVNKFQSCPRCCGMSGLQSDVLICHIFFF